MASPRPVDNSRCATPHRRNAVNCFYSFLFRRKAQEDEIYVILSPYVSEKGKRCGSKSFVQCYDRRPGSRRKAENPQSVGGVVCRLRPSRPRRINICLLYSIWFPLFYIEGLDPSRSPVWTLLEGRRLLERIDQSWPTFQLQHVKLVAAQQKKKKKRKRKKRARAAVIYLFPSGRTLNFGNELCEL